MVVHAFHRSRSLHRFDLLSMVSMVAMALMVSLGFSGFTGTQIRSVASAWPKAANWMVESTLKSIGPC